MASFSLSSATSSIIIILFMIGSSYACLSTNFYSKSCPNLFNVVKPVIQSAISQNNRNGASILRLFFHDCFVNGCDGSILLDDTPTFTGEQHARPNNGSILGFKIIENIKKAVEKSCPGVVSCADVLAIAARDSVVILGGPNWNVKLGRRDARTASITTANNDIPSPALNLSQLINNFKKQGLSTKDMVALSGGHTIGQARCISFRPHIYNDANIDSSFAKLRQSNCLNISGSSDSKLAPLDLQTPNKFDVKYYENLIKNKGLLHSDQELFNGGSTDSLVKKYSSSKETFFKDFVNGMIKMGDIKPLIGSNGEIRKVCSKIN